MKDNELIEILKEFDEKRVEQLNDNARNLFNAIMDIANQRDKLLEEKQELIDYLKEEMNNIELELVMKSQNDYELGKLQGYYKSCKEILSKIEKR